MTDEMYFTIMKSLRDSIFQAKKMLEIVSLEELRLYYEDDIQQLEKSLRYLQKNYLDLV